MDNFNSNNPEEKEPNDVKENNLSNTQKVEEHSQKIAMDSIKDENTYSYSHKPKNSGFKLISMVLIGAILGSAITFGTVYNFLPEILNMRGIALGNSGQEITINPSEDLTVYSAVAQKVMPSVVGITTVELQRNWFYGVQEVPGVGTGVIIDSRGYILTNSHVIGDGNAEEIKVLLNDGRQLEAEVLWHETSLDLAVIKVEGDNLKPAELGNSDETEVGEIAIAIGNPLGLTFERTLTQGVISGLNRTINVGNGGSIENLIQTDASINPGNSGGPLLNAKGEVIGINTAKVSSGEGLGFAIPINIAKPIVDQFIENGEFTRVYLGIQGIDVDSFEAATGMKLPIDEGVYVFRVTEDSSALEYGINPGDIILKLGDDEINNMSSLTRAIYKYRPGDETTVTVLRNDKEIEIDIVFK